MIIRSIKFAYKANVLAMQKHHIHPTLEGRIPTGSFGLPKTFRVPQNTTCYVPMFLCSYVRLNINFQCLEITIQQSKFYSNINIGALVITLIGYLFITNKQIKQ